MTLGRTSLCDTRSRGPGSAGSKFRLHLKIRPLRCAAQSRPCDWMRPNGRPLRGLRKRVRMSFEYIRFHRAEDLSPPQLSPNRFTNLLASMERRVHPAPFRTRKLSASSPMILRIYAWERRPKPTLKQLQAPLSHARGRFARFRRVGEERRGEEDNGSYSKLFIPCTHGVGRPVGRSARQRFERQGGFRGFAPKHHLPPAGAVKNKGRAKGALPLQHGCARWSG